MKWYMSVYIELYWLKIEHNQAKSKYEWQICKLYLLHNIIIAIYSDITTSTVSKMWFVTDSKLIDNTILTESLDSV
jgi:hypothetical protein